MDEFIKTEFSEIKIELKEVRQTLQKLALVEERLANTAATYERMQTRNDSQFTDIYTRLNVLEKANVKSDFSLGAFAKFGWLLLGASITLAVKYLGG